MTEIKGLNLAALNAIADENTRIALQSIVDGFAYAAAPDKVSALTLTRVKQEQSSQKSSGIKPADIPGIINNLQAQLMETQLFKSLGDRIAQIDKPGGIFERLEAAETVLKEETDQRIDGDTAITESVKAIGVRVGNSETAIKDEISQRANADNAITESVSTQYAELNNALSLVQEKITTASNEVSAIAQKYTQLQASVGNLSSAIRQESEARANADGALYAQYTLRVDVNGRVSGFGLASNSSSSDFAIRADRFYVASPSGNGIVPAMPFIVLTTPTIVGGMVVPPGVYIDKAFIADGTITRAKIGVAEIDTLRLGGSAVTVSTFASAASNHGWPNNLGSPINTTPRTVCSTVLSTGPLGGLSAGTIITATASLYEGEPTNASIKLQIWVDGGLVASSACTLGESKSITTIGHANLSEGTHTVEARLCTGPEDGTASTKKLSCNAQIVCMSGKR